MTYTIEALAADGGHIVAQKTIYGGSYNLLEHTLSHFGVSTTFVDAHNLEAVEGAIQENTRTIYLRLSEIRIVIFRTSTRLLKLHTNTDFN